MRMFFVLAGGMLGFVATWIFAFAFYNVPYTTSGAHEVVLAAAPFGIFCGCLIGALIAYHWRCRR